MEIVIAKFIINIRIILIKDHHLKQIIMRHIQVSNKGFMGKIIEVLNDKIYTNKNNVENYLIYIFVKNFTFFCMFIKNFKNIF